MSKAITRILVSALALVTATTKGADLFVAPGGNDANPGAQAKPFATLARARDEVRQLKQAGPLREPVTVWVRGGISPATRISIRRIPMAAAGLTRTGNSSRCTRTCRERTESP